MNLNGLARSLAQAGLIKTEHAQQALEIAKSEKSSFITIAVQKG